MADARAQHEAEDPVMSIGVLAQKVGLSVSAVRRYENEGLIIAHRTESGHRLFSHEDIGRVRHIQRMIQDLGLNVEGIRRMLALLPCWNLHPCNAEARKNCPAPKADSQPCWMIKGRHCAPKGNECRRCVVYRYGSLSTQDIKRLLHDQNDAQNGGTALHELRQRLRDSRQESA